MYAIDGTLLSTDFDEQHTYLSRLGLCRPCTRAEAGAIYTCLKVFNRYLPSPDVTWPEYMRETGVRCSNLSDSYRLSGSGEEDKWLHCEGERLLQLPPTTWNLLRRMLYPQSTIFPLVDWRIMARNVVSINTARVVEGYSIRDPDWVAWATEYLERTQSC